MNSDDDFVSERDENELEGLAATRGHNQQTQGPDFREAGKFLWDCTRYLAKIGIPVAPLAAQKFVLPPKGFEELKGLAVFLCLVGSAIVLVYRGRIEYALNERVSKLRLTPLFAALTALAGTVAAVFYLWRQPATDFIQATIYVLLWPAYAVPLTAILLCLDHKRRKKREVESILAQLTGHYRHIVFALRHIARFESTSQQIPAFAEFGHEILRQTCDAFRDLAHGRILMDVVHMADSFDKLVNAYDRFDAISVVELPFWGPRGDSFAQIYYKSCAELPCSGKIATRIFVVSEEELEQFKNLLAKVLIKHIRDGIGVAVVLYEDLPESLRQLGNNQLDFALWNLAAAWSSFRQNEGAVTRKIVIGFSEPDTAKKLAIYKQILNHALIVDRKFKEAHSTLLTELKRVIEERKNRLSRVIGGAVTPDGEFFFEISDDREVIAKVQAMAKVWEMHRHESRDLRTEIEVDQKAAETGG
jgi:hypothetical protein